MHNIWIENPLHCYRRSLCVRLLVTTVSPANQLNRPRCRLSCGLVGTQEGAPEPPTDPQEGKLLRRTYWDCLDILTLTHKNRHNTIRDGILTCIEKLR